MSINQNGKKRILCVEHCEDMCLLITTVLDAYQVVGANCKADALQKAMNKRFDLYLLDYYLPDGNGLELCLLIRTFDADTPIFFCTGKDSLTNSQILKAGAQGLIKEGVGFVDDLAMTIARILPTSLSLSDGTAPA